MMAKAKDKNPEVLNKEPNKWMTMLTRGEKAVVASDVLPVKKLALRPPSLTWALTGGISEGYTVCWYGPEQGGKSLTTMIATASIQEAYPEGIVVLISSEMREPSQEKLMAIGVDPSRLVIYKLNTLHDIFDWIACRDSKFKFSDGSDDVPGLAYMLSQGAPIKGLIIDSIKAIRGPKEMSKDSVEDDFMGDLSRFLNPALKKVLPIIREFKLYTMFVQQVNMNMNPDEVKYQGKKWTVPSGQALKHFCETMVLVERVNSKESKIFDPELEGIRELPLQTGHTVRCTVEKANLDTPFRTAEFRINYKLGVVDVGLEVFKLAKALQVIYHPKNAETGKEINNQWAFQDEAGSEKWFGAEETVNALEQNPELRRRVMVQVNKK